MGIDFERLREKGEGEIGLKDLRDSDSEISLHDS